MERIAPEQFVSAIVSVLNFKIYGWYERQNTNLPMDEYARTAPSNWIFDKIPIARLGRFVEAADIHQIQTTFIGVFVWFRPQYKLKMMALSKDDLCAQLAPSREVYRYRQRRLAPRLVSIEAIADEQVIVWTVNVGFEDKPQARAYQKQLWDEKRCAHAKFRDRAYSHIRTDCPYELKIWFLDPTELERLQQQLQPLWVQRPDPQGDYQFLRQGRVEACVPDKTRCLDRIRQHLERGDAVMLRDIAGQVDYRAQLAAGRVVLHPQQVG
jgi:hypothetical protein